MNKVHIILMSILVCSCANFQEGKVVSREWKVFSQLEVGKDTQAEVRGKLGAPDEIYNEGLGPNEEQWNYMRREIPKIHVFFVDGIAQSSSVDVWEGEDLADVAVLLKELSGEWSVEQEPVTIPHAMPFLCYLLDESGGKKIEIHAYKKVVESIFRWNPKIPQNKKQRTKTYPDVDEHRCAWLAEFIKR